MRKNVILADCLPAEIASLAGELSYNSQKFEIESCIANWKRTGVLSEIKRYGIYFAVGFRCFLNRHKYGVIVGWQQFYTLIFCFFSSVFKVKKENIVVALNFTYKEKNGIFSKPYQWFMQKCISKKYLDYIHVPSDQYADAISRDFAFPRERIIVTPFGVNDDYDTYMKLDPPTEFPKDGYALAIGRSNRDYDFLIHAWEGIDYPLVIISDTYKGGVSGENVTLITNVAGEESYPWIANCGLMILPIDDGSICSGDTVLLTAMSLKRKIIVTVPSTLAEMYVVDGENALLSNKDYAIFKDTVMRALYSGEYMDLGERARESYLKNYSRQSMGQKISAIMNSHNECVLQEKS